MKTELTTEQSKHLIELGVPSNRASMTSNQLHGDPYYNDYYQEIFTLDDLLEMLPKEIEIPVFYDDLEEPEYYTKYRIAFEWDSNKYGQTEPQYNAFYKEIAFIPGGYLAKFNSEELIDALYELTIWCIENGHLKF